MSPDVAAGHSYGEIVALHAAGAFDASTLAEISEARGRFLLVASGEEPGTMAALPVGPERTREVLNGWTDVTAVNFNGPSQTVIAGPREAVARAIASARDLGYRARELPVACAFHTSLVAGASGPLTRLLTDRIASTPRVPVYANLDSEPHPADVARIADRMGRHLASPVRFAPMIERMHADGARVFLECGPGGLLSPLVGSILGDRAHVAIALDAAGRAGIPSFLLGLARLISSGVALNLDRLTVDRFDRSLDLDALPRVGQNVPPPSTWLVNGSRARPVDQPEPRRLGQAGLSPTVRPRPGDLARVAPMTEVASPRIAHRPVSSPPVANEKPAPTTPACGPANDRVMMAFQETMRQFLEVQNSTMRDYLASRNGPGRTVPAARESRPSPDAPPPSVPREEAPKNPIAVPDVEAAPRPQVKAVVPSDRDAIAATLVAIVRDRTGYPPEMLKLDLDLEADLGIDSIKRVEILGSLRDAYASLAPSLDSGAMDDLARARTLGAIVDRFSKALGGPGDLAPREESAAVRRLVIESVAVPLPEGRASLVPGGVVLVTDDAQGVARAVAAELEAAGHPSVVVDPSRCDLTSPSAIADLLDQARGRGALAGIVHASPLRASYEKSLDASRWDEHLGHDLRGLFLLARAAAGDLETSARLGGSCLIAATAMGGSFGSVGPIPERFNPLDGGVVGLVKTLAREWPSVRVRAVDLDAADAIESIAERPRLRGLRRRGSIRNRIRAGSPDRPENEAGLAGARLVATGHPCRRADPLDRGRPRDHGSHRR